MTVATESLHPARRAFDAIAEAYDSLFTTSVVGRSQRAAVWRQATTVFRSGDRVLELNCGTGEDALFLATRGVAVYACDASPAMIARARSRQAAEAPSAAIEFKVLCTEDVGIVFQGKRFDGVFSNFSGLNCVADLAQTACDISTLTQPGARLLLCLSTRFCAWEILHYLFRREFRKCFRRIGGIAQADLRGHLVTVYYPTLRSVLKSFRPMFRLRGVTGIGVAVPPSYMEAWARRNKRLFWLCEAADPLLCHLPGARVLGDHMLLDLERV